MATPNGWPRRQRSAPTDAFSTFNPPGPIPGGGDWLHYSKRGRSEDLGLAAQVAAVAAELEQPRFAAMPATLELDGGQVMTVIEAGGDQKQGFQVGAVLELVVLDEVLQLHRPDRRDQ